jgi:hypothetical protein
MTVAAASETFEFRSDLASRTYLPTRALTSSGAYILPAPLGAGLQAASYAELARSSDSSPACWSKPGRLAEKAFFMCS